jgi:hypothetical protein
MTTLILRAEKIEILPDYFHTSVRLDGSFSVDHSVFVKMYGARDIDLSLSAPLDCPGQMFFDWYRN